MTALCRTQVGSLPNPGSLGKPAMKRILVWDLPVRLFHWILTVAFVVAFLIALNVGHRTPVFAVHMLLGGIAAFMVLLRLVWGFVGTRWARFDSFVMRPREMVL